MRKLLISSLYTNIFTGETLRLATQSVSLSSLPLLEFPFAAPLVVSPVRQALDQTDNLSVDIRRPVTISKRSTGFNSVGCTQCTCALTEMLWMAEAWSFGGKKTFSHKKLIHFPQCTLSLWELRDHLSGSSGLNGAIYNGLIEICVKIW